jgi:uncharacterized protein (TIGR03118 family)
MKRLVYSVAVLGLIMAACSDDNDSSINNNGTNPTPASTNVVARGDIVSDQAGAAVTDPMLVNAWGLAFNPVGAAWVSAEGTGVSGVYDANGNQLIPSVRIPAPGNEPSEPTGQVFNTNTASFMGDLFIFATANGSIAGWQPSMGAQATQRVDSSPLMANYKGITIATDANGVSRLYAADLHGAKIDVFDTAYRPVTTAGNFRDPQVPAGFAPFNVQAHQGAVLVAFAKQDAMMEDEEAGPGLGYVDLFDAQGTLVQRLVAAGELNAPWGMVMTPSSFGSAPNRLLIGNFGDGRIHVYNWQMTVTQQLTVPVPTQAAARLEGSLIDPNGVEIVLDGLWDLKFGVDAGGFRSDTLYFTAGPDDEEHGIFGRLSPAAAQAPPQGTGGTGGAGGTGTAGAGGSGGTGTAGVGGSGGTGPAGAGGTY